MDIIEFLNARLNEDEATAKMAIDPTRPGTHWHWATNTTDTPGAVSASTPTPRPAPSTSRGHVRQ